MNNELTKVEFLQSGENSQLGVFTNGETRAIATKSAKVLKERGVVKILDVKKGYEPKTKEDK